MIPIFTGLRCSKNPTRTRTCKALQLPPIPAHAPSLPASLGPSHSTCRQFLKPGTRAASQGCSLARCLPVVTCLCPCTVSPLDSPPPRSCLKQPQPLSYLLCVLPSHHCAIPPFFCLTPCLFLCLPRREHYESESSACSAHHWAPRTSHGALHGKHL